MDGVGVVDCGNLWERGRRGRLLWRLGCWRERFEGDEEERDGERGIRECRLLLVWRLRE